MSAVTAPVGRDAELASQLRPTRTALRGGAAAVAASRRRGATMGSRVATSRSKEAVYPMFLELARACEDIDAYWQRFFDTMATGRFPKGVILRDDCLVHRSRKKTSTFELTPEARSDWQNVAEFFRTTCDIRSDRDWAQRRASGEAVVQLTTAQINKRVKKEHANAIPEFTLTLKTRYSLSPAEMSEIDVLLRYYSTSNLFRPGDVVYGTSGAIREIKTLLFDEATRRFTISAEAKAPRYAMKESYQDAVSYLTGSPFTKPVERKIGFDDEIRKQLRQLYAPQVAAREKAAVAAAQEAEARLALALGGEEEGLKPIRKSRQTAAAKKAAALAAVPVIAEEDVITEDDDVEPIEESRHRRHSDDDSA